MALNYKDDSVAARQWLKDYLDPYQVNVADPQGLLGINLGVYGAPETFLIDTQGIIRHKYVGAIDERVWREEPGAALPGAAGGPAVKRLLIACLLGSSLARGPRRH